MKTGNNLHDKAISALLAGKDAEALLLFSQLHKENLNDLRIFIKVADLREKTGDIRGAVADYGKIAHTYAANGYMVQAIAISKIILRIDPGNTEIQDMFRALSDERDDSLNENLFLSADKETVADENIRTGLASTPLLSGMHGEQLESFINSLQLRHVSAGENICQMGDPGTYLYLIGMGQVSLQAIDTQGNKQVFSHLAEGAFFGERAFMSRVTQTSEAFAETDCTLLLMDRTTFDNWVQKHPEMRATVETFYRQRVLARLLAITPVFEGVPVDARMALADQFTLRTFDDGDLIMKEGDIGSTFYLIRSGFVTLTVADSLGEAVFTTTLGEGEFIGEVALLSGRPRTATIYAHGSAELMELPRSSFNLIAGQYPSIRNVVQDYMRRRAQETIKAFRHHAKSDKV